MKSHRFWIEIIIAGTAVACAVALLIGTVSAFVGAASASFGQAQARSMQARPVGTEQTYEGVVTCSRCAARHSAALGKTAADCARTCVHNGAKFTLVAGDKTYRLEGDDADLRRIAGERVSIVGVLAGNAIRCSVISAPK